MKLLPPREAAVEKEKKQAADIAEITLLTETRERLRKEINTEEVQFQKRLEEQRAAYGAAKDKYIQEMREIDSAITTRRAELAILLKPIDEIREYARLRAEAVTVREAAADKHDEENAEVIRNIQLRIDELTEREGILVVGETDLRNRKAGIDAEAAMVSNGHKKLNQEIKAFREKQSKRAAELSAFEVNLAAKKKAHDILMTEERKRNAEKLKEIDNEWIRIADERKVIQRIWNELENKRKI